MSLNIFSLRIMCIFLPIFSFASGIAMSMENINEFLGNSARSDIIGPEMWTADLLDIPDFRADGTSNNYMTAQLPYYSWEPPRPGMSGLWHLCHPTELNDVVQIIVKRVDNGKETILNFTPSRNRWTPARMTTWYRAKPSGFESEYPNAGYLSLKETKCITQDNVFIAELTLFNDNNLSQEYSLNIVAPYFKKDGSAGDGILKVDTAANAGGLGNKGPIIINGWGALISSTGNTENILKMKPYEKITLRYAFCFDEKSSSVASKRAISAINENGVFDKNVHEFELWFKKNVPQLKISDPDILKNYYYRWFVVYRGLHNPKRVIAGHPYPRPAFYESPTGGWYGCVIGLPVPCHIQETRWIRDGEPGWGDILNWSESVQGYRGYIQFTPMTIWQFYKSHPNQENLAKVFEPAKIFSFEDSVPGGLPIMHGSWGTGAEYQPNFYQFTTPQWDYRNDSEFAGKENFKITDLIRLDKAGYAIANIEACSQMALVLGLKPESEKLARTSYDMLTIIKSKHWDDKTGMFYAADPKTYRLADQAPCYDSFAPFIWGMITEKKYLRAFDKFFDPQWFWSDFPIRTCSQTCPMYWSGNSIVGPTAATQSNPHYYGCSWNGPTWHYANSLMAEALGSAAVNEPGLRNGWLEFIRLWTDLHFLYGDRSVPCSREHHRPSDGARYGTTTDYFHSAWIDPFVRYFIGVRIGDDLDTVTFDPFSHEAFRIDNLPVLGKELSFEQNVSENGEITKIVYASDGKIIKKAVGTAAIAISKKEF